MRRNVAIFIAISIFFICENKIATAFLAHVTPKSKLSAICHQRIRLASTSGDWSPHKSLGDAKVKELAVEEAAKQDAVKKQEGDAKLKAMMAAAAAEVAEAEAAQAELQLTAPKRQEEEVKQAAVAKKQDEAKLGAMMMAAAADVAEADAVLTARKIADSEKIQEDAKLAAVLQMKEEVRLAAVAMEAAAEVAELEAAESAKQSAMIRQQEERQLELNRLAAVAGIADAQEKAEQLQKERLASSTAINSNPIQLQDMLLSKSKTPLENALSAEVVSSSITTPYAQEAADVFDIMQASAEAEAAQVNISVFDLQSIFMCFTFTFSHTHFVDI